MDKWFNEAKALESENVELKRQLREAEAKVKRYEKALVMVRDFDDHSPFDDPGYIAIQALTPPTNATKGGE